MYYSVSRRHEILPKTSAKWSTVPGFKYPLTSVIDFFQVNVVENKNRYLLEIDGAPADLVPKEEDIRRWDRPDQISSMLIRLY